MNAIGIAFTAVCSALLVALPRRLAVIPLLLAVVFMTRGQVLEIGPAHFTVIRILVAVGVLRVIVRGERLAHGIGRLDLVIALWAVVLIATSAFHTADAWIFRAGIVWTELGCYLLIRVFLSDGEDVQRAFKVLCVALVPVALAMLLEKHSGENLFAFLGGVNEVSALREGKVRASGPFTHAILAGTVGATCFPMALYLWARNRLYALAGFFAAGGIVFSSSSSGPALMVMFIAGALALWRLRTALPAIRWLALACLVSLDLVMRDPVYFLAARVDITGGSTGWHRARLIQASIEHLGEWWLTGTDYTRHWMPTGIPANEIHTDITNHFLQVGVWGGLPLMVIYILAIFLAFHSVGRVLRRKGASVSQRFLVWTLGATLFGQVMNALSISLFDQTIVLVYLILAGICALDQRTSAAPRMDFGRRRDPEEASRGPCGAFPRSRLEHGTCLERIQPRMSPTMRLELT